MDKARVTGTPPRRAARPIRVRARFTPTRSTVFRGTPEFGAVAPVGPPAEDLEHDDLQADGLPAGDDASVDASSTAPATGADTEPTAAAVEPVEAPVVEDPVSEAAHEEPAPQAVVEPVTEEPVVEPVVEAPVAEEPVVETALAEPADEEPVAESAVVEPDAEQSVVEPTVPEPVAEEHVTESAVVEPVAAPPVAPSQVPPPPAVPAGSRVPAPPAVPARPASPAVAAPAAASSANPYQESETLAQALGLKPSPSGAPATAGVRKGPRARRDAAGPRRRWLPVALVAAAVAVLVAVMSIRAAVIGDAEPSQAGSAAGVGASATPSSSATVAAVVGWLKANPVGARTLAVDPDATALRGAGVDVTSGALASAQTGDAVVVTVPTASVTDPVAVDDTHSWVPLAAFGDGDTRAVVGVVLGRGAAEVADERASAASTARAACTALAQNVAVDIDPDVRPVFDSGLVDLRVTAFLAALSQETPVQVLGVRVDDAERTAGTPARVVELSGAAADAARALATQAHGTFAPVVADGDGGRLVLTWSVEPDPASLTAR